MIELDPNHPALLQGRRHSRDVLASAARVVNAAQETKRSADAASTVSTGLQLVVSTALVDGFDPQEVYGGAAGLLAWLVCRLRPEDQLGVLMAMTAEVVDRMKLAEKPRLLV